jgi:Lipase (class 3)
MPTINYDPTQESLFRPYIHPTVFTRSVPVISDGVCAELSRMAYIPFESNLPVNITRLSSELNIGGFQLIKTFNKEDTQAILVFHQELGQYVLAFRGSELTSWKDWFVDALAFKQTWPQGGKVHSGFAGALDVIWPEIEKSIQNIPSIFLTGHSLGGALATLAASKMKSKCQKLVTIGAPAVGNAEFASLTEKALSGKMARYVNCCDVVCRVPFSFMGFRHLNAELYINKDGIPSSRTPSDQSDGRKQFKKLYPSVQDRAAARDLADHAPINYIRALWP